MVFNEVMADPDPEILLPAEEYLELYNRSEYPLDLSHWRLYVNHRNYDLIKRAELDPGFTSPMLEPFSYKVIKGISLPNEGATLALYNEKGTLVHATSYRVPWDETDWKKEGGWSLESPDPNQMCLLSEWWTYSTDPLGGTPGRINSAFSIREDVEVPTLLFYGYESPEALVITYSEPVTLSTLNPRDFLLRPGSLFPSG